MCHFVADVEVLDCEKKHHYYLVPSFLCVKYLPGSKPRLHERFFAHAGDAIFSNFVELPARDENRMCSHP